MGTSDTPVCPARDHANQDSERTGRLNLHPMCKGTQTERSHSSVSVVKTIRLEPIPNSFAGYSAAGGNAESLLTGIFFRHIFHQHSKLNLNLTAELLANKWQAEWTYSHNRTATDAGVVYLRK